MTSFIATVNRIVSASRFSYLFGIPSSKRR
jgi:hypothetical protein